MLRISQGFVRSFGLKLRVSDYTWSMRPDLLAPSMILIQQPRCGHRSKASKKHYDVKWRKLRAAKVMTIELPDFDKRSKDAKMNPEDRRAEMKKEGFLPPRNFIERPINISASSEIFEPYVPPEGDGRQSFISRAGATQKIDKITKKSKAFWDLRKIKQFDEDFEMGEFAKQGQSYYIETHELLQDMKKNDIRLHDLLTEKAFPEMTHTLDKKTFRWRFIETVEPPRVVHMKTNEMMTKGNLYGQVTVRLHTRQTLAIYDRFGRLMYGSEHLVKDILEYVVFEKHLANEYGLWRIHGKVVPDWMPPRQSAIRTYRHQEIDIPEGADDEEQTPGAVEKAQTVAVTSNTAVTGTEQPPGAPQPATA